MITLGILGAGLFSQKKLLSTYKKIPHTSIYVGSISKSGTELFTYEDILQNKEISVIHIANAPHMHYKTLVSSIESGKHTICEKPLCINYKEAKLITEKSENLKIHIHEGLAYRFHPQWKEIFQIVTSKELGELRWIQTSLCYFAEKNFKTLGHRNIEGPGSGIFWDLACYPVDASIRMDPSDLVSIQSTKLKKNNVTIQSSFLLQFASGVTSCVILDMNSQSHQFSQITFEKGTISLETPYITPSQGKVTLRIKKLGQKEKILVYKDINVYREQFYWFMNKIRENRPNDTKILESAKILETIDNNACVVIL